MEKTNPKKPSTPTGPKPPRTLAIPFTTIGKHSLLVTQADVPVYLMMEQASALLDATRVLVTNRDSFDLTAEATITQFMVEMSQAMVESCCEGLEALEPPTL